MLKVCLRDGETVKLTGRISDMSSLANWWERTIQVMLEVGAKKLEMSTELHTKAAPVKIRRSTGKPSVKAVADKELFNGLVTAIYGKQPGHFAAGDWGVEASNIVRQSPKLV